jgi:hypothetical protein
MRREIHKCGGSSERMFNIFKINISRIKDFGAARNERQKEEPARKRNLKKKKGVPKKECADNIYLFIYFFLNKRHSGEIRAFWVECVCRVEKEKRMKHYVRFLFFLENHRSFSFFDVSLKNLVQPERTQTTHPTKR